MRLNCEMGFGNETRLETAYLFRFERNSRTKSEQIWPAQMPLRRVFIGGSDLQQLRFSPLRAVQGYADGQAARRKSAGQGNHGEAREIRGAIHAQQRAAHGLGFA